jgi:hypothetical protein
MTSALSVESLLSTKASAASTSSDAGQGAKEPGDSFAGVLVEEIAADERSGFSSQTNSDGLAGSGGDSGDLVDAGREGEEKKESAVSILEAPTMTPGLASVGSDGMNAVAWSSVILPAGMSGATAMEGTSVQIGSNGEEGLGGQTARESAALPIATERSRGVNEQTAQTARAQTESQIIDATSVESSGEGNRSGRNQQAEPPQNEAVAFKTDPHSGEKDHAVRGSRQEAASQANADGLAASVVQEQQNPVNRGNSDARRVIVPGDSSRAAGQADMPSEKVPPKGNDAPAEMPSVSGRRTEEHAKHAESVSSGQQDDGEASDPQSGAKEWERMLRDVAMQAKKDPSSANLTRPSEAAGSTLWHDKSGIAGNHTLLQPDTGVLTKDAGLTTYRTERLQDLVDRIDQHVLLLSKNGDRSMTVTLIPEKLGKVILNCREDGGQIAVQIQAENGVAREMLQRQEMAIRTLLEQNGYRLGQFDVRTNDEGRGGRRQAASRMDEDEESNEAGAGRGSKGRAASPVAESVETRRSGGIWLIA